MSKRPLLLPLSVAALLAVASLGPTHAACLADRQIVAPYSYVYTPGVANGYLDSTVTSDFAGAFWALEEGHPADLAGIDNGKFRAIDGNFDGWLRIRPRVTEYGYPPAILSSWNASERIDGCIDTSGSDPVEPDAQQCMVMLFSDQRSGVGYFAVASAAADAAGNYDLAVPGDQPILLTAIPFPVSDYDPYLDDLTNAVTIPPPQLEGSGQFLDLDCPDPIVGYRVYRQILPPGSEAPVDRRRDDGDGIGWEVAIGGQLPSGQPLPLTQSAELVLPCSERSDVYLAFSLAFDSGFETAHLSRNHLPFSIGCCSDADGDGVCAEPGETREHDCDDGNPDCAADCADGDQDGHCVPGDCADAEPAIHPGVAEACDGVDNNCDGRSDEAPAFLGAVDATGAAPGAGFGQAAAALGDIDRDGYGDFAIGAGSDTAAGIAGAGSVTIFSGRTRAPLQRLLHPDPQPGDRFGAGLARIDDVNVDGIDDILVGAGGDDTAAGVDAGSAFVFSGSAASAFELLHVLEDPSGAPGDALGDTVAALGDHNADGVGDVALGAPGALGDRGRVIVFSGAGGYPMRTLSDAAGLPGDRFGCAVLAGDDLDSSGVAELLVASCHGDSPVAARAGKVTVIAGDTWQPVLTLFDPLGAADDGFGEGLAGLGDIDGDGVGDVLVGAGDDDDPVAGADAGGAAILSGIDGSLIRRLAPPDPGPGDRFGAQVAGLGDLDGDGIGDVAVGAPSDDTADGAGAGSVTVFSAATGGVIRRLVSPAGAAGAGFGSTVAALAGVDDDEVPDLLIGSPGADSGAGSGTGDAEVFAGAGAWDADGDGAGDACDCAPLDATARFPPGELQGLMLQGASPTLLSWVHPGDGFAYDVAGGSLSVLRIDGGLSAAVCIIHDAPAAPVADSRPPPAVGEGYYYLPRARNACGAGGYGEDSSGAPRLPGDCP